MKRNFADISGKVNINKTYYLTFQIEVNLFSINYLIRLSLCGPIKTRLFKRVFIGCGDAI